MMNSASPGPYAVEWRPSGAEEHDLVMLATAPGPEAARRIATATGAATFRIQAGDGTEAVADAAAVAAWPDDAKLPTSSATWPAPRRPGGDPARAERLLGAFLSWSRSRGVLDEAACRRISTAVQMEMAGEAPGTPP